MSFRKRKVIAPYFRMPNPTNPVSAKSHYLYPPLKQYTRFTLLEALTTEDEKAEAEITNADQWGQNPIFHPVDVHITVRNQLSDDEETYVFSGEIGDVGLALHDHTNQWRIITMFRQGSRGGCLAENHPGRGVLFDIHLGTWDSAGTAPHWNYEAVATVKAIDWRYGVPFPDAGATGLFEARKSDVHGTVWEVTSLDCESPGACGS